LDIPGKKKTNYSERFTKMSVTTQIWMPSLLWTPLFNYKLSIQVSSHSTVEKTTYCRMSQHLNALARGGRSV
jgi:hypothetical protein